MKTLSIQDPLLVVVVVAFFLLKTESIETQPSGSLTWCEEVVLNDLDDGEALQRVREQHRDDKRVINDQCEWCVLRDATYDQLVHVVAVTQVADHAERREDDEHDEDVGVEEVSEHMLVALHTRLYRHDLWTGARKA